MHDRDHIWVAATAWFIGVCAVLCDHFQPPPQLSIALHALFAIATCGAISLVLIDKARALAGTSQPELYQFTRLVSRWVYILLYALAVIRMTVHLYEASGYCMLCGPQNTAGPVRPLDDFQFYIACCVASLWLIRALVLALPFKRRTFASAHVEKPAVTTSP